MTDIEILRQMIKDTATVEVVVKNGKNQVTLTEPHPDAEAVEVPIYGLPNPNEVIVIKADAFKSPDSLFKCTKGECRRADYVIVAETDNKKVIVCIEMKVTKSSEKDIIKQLTGAQCLMMYCQSVGKTFWKQDNFLEGYAYRFVSIAHISVSVGKRKTCVTRPEAPKHDSPDKMLKINWPHRIRFNILAGSK